MTPCVIAIAGPSGSGKSLFAERLLAQLGKALPDDRVALLREDAYYRDRSDLNFAEREALNYDHPDALEHRLLAAHIDALRDGQPVEVPRYDYAQHARRADTERVDPAPLIIVEGILLLNDSALRTRFDIRFYMDTPMDICLLRRIERDLRERGRSLESVSRQYQDSVRPMHQAFIGPSAAYADMLITGGGMNDVALQIVGDMILTRLQASRSRSVL